MADLTRPIIGIENRTAQEVFDIMCDRFRAAERALTERAGGVKVKADKMHRRAQLAEALYQSTTDTLRMWREVLGPGRRHDDFTLFSFALADMEKAKARIDARLSTLTTELAAPIVDHPRNTNSVVSHETANVEDKPRGLDAVLGRPEPYGNLREPAAPEGRQDVGDEPFEVLPDGSYQRRTRPSEQAVTERMDGDVV